MFSLVRNCQTVFQRGCTILHSRQQRMRVPVAPHPHQHFMLSVFQIMAILTGVYWYLTVVLVCISLMTWCGASISYAYLSSVYLWWDVFGPLLIRLFVLLLQPLLFESFLFFQQVWTNLFLIWGLESSAKWLTNNSAETISNPGQKFCPKQRSWQCEEKERQSATRGLASGACALILNKSLAASELCVFIHKLKTLLWGRPAPFRFQHVSTSFW